MKLIAVSIRNQQGKLLRVVNCREGDVAQQAEAGESASPATEADHVEHRAAMAAVLAHAKSFAAQAEPSEAEILLEALATKVGLTPADLAAARQKRKAAKAIHGA